MVGVTKKAACEAEQDLSGEDIKSIDANNANDDPNKPKAWGYDLYPERKGTYTPQLKYIFSGYEGKEAIDKMKCERNVYDCFKTSPVVRLMAGALKSSGCPIDLRRHISCEVCDSSVTGGYDPSLNQIVVCQNMAKRRNMVQGVLTHEMVHMFDYCRKDLNFKNMEHLACTEIRAANLTHCSFMSAWSQGDAFFDKISKAHQDCVKTKAIYSVLAVRQVEKEEATRIVDKVFPFCYYDLEPIGRRIRRNSDDMDRALKEGKYYGYHYDV